MRYNRPRGNSRWTRLPDWSNKSRCCWKVNGNSWKVESRERSLPPKLNLHWWFDKHLTNWLRFLNRWFQNGLLQSPYAPGQEPRTGPGPNCVSAFHFGNNSVEWFGKCGVPFHALVTFKVGTRSGLILQQTPHLYTSVKSAVKKALILHDGNPSEPKRTVIW